MKRSISFVCAIFLCLSLVVSLSSCNRDTLETFNDATPEELYSLAIDSIKDMSNYEIVHEQTVSTSAFLVFKNEIHQTTTVKMDGKNFYQNIECDSEEVFDASDVLECWYVDGYFYAEAMGHLRKQECSQEKINGSIYDTKSADGTLLNLPDSLLKESSFYCEENEVYLELVLDGEEYFEYVLKSGGDTSFEGYAENDVTYRVYFHEDGTVDRIHSRFDCVITEEGIPVKVVVDTVSTVKNINNTEVTLPDGAEFLESGFWFSIR